MPRKWWQRSVTPFINPLLLTFGLYANYTAHLLEMLAGNPNPNLSETLTRGPPPERFASYPTPTPDPYPYPYP